MNQEAEELRMRARLLIQEADRMLTRATKLDRHVGPEQSPPIPAAKIDYAHRIVDSVAEATGIRAEHLIGRGRTYAVSEARAVAAYCVRMYSGLPFDQVGAILGGRTYSAIDHEIRSVSNRSQTDAKYRNWKVAVMAKVSEILERRQEAVA